MKHIKRFYAFDFDGVIGLPPGKFKGDGHENNPNHEVVGAIRQLKEVGHTIIVYSTRSTDFLKKYCEKNDIPVDHFNVNPKFDNLNRGKPVATVYIDDRALCYRGQSTQELIDELTKFEPYHHDHSKDGDTQSC